MANTIKRHFFNNQHYVLNKEAKTVRLLPEFFEKLKNKSLWNKFGFKKVGGSTIGDVLEVDQFKSPFAAFCRIAWIGLPILDRKYVDAGIAIEPKVVAALEKLTKKKILTYDPKEFNYDFFAEKDDVVGGLPDGFIEEDKIILEIKTTGMKNFMNWKVWGIPTAYLKQAQLYAFLMNVPHYSIVATFLEEQDYEKPEEYPIEKRKMKNWIFNVDVAEVKDDIQKVKTWYANHTNSGCSPMWNERKDVDLLKWLEPSNLAEWEILKQEWIQAKKIVE